MSIRPIFIIGCPRSGTYLLLKLIISSFQLASPIETHFIPYFRRYLFLYGNLEKTENRKRLVDAIFEFLEIWTPIMMQSETVSDFKDQSLLKVKVRTEDIVRNSNSYDTIIEEIFSLFAKSQNKECWVDKSAFFECVDLNSIVNLPSDPFVIHIVRDGRDVACSWLETWHGPKSYISAAIRWKQHVTTKRAWGKKHPNRYLELSYESLVNQPEKVILQVGKFINKEPTSLDVVDHKENMLTKTLSKLDSHKLINSKVSKKRVNRFEKDLPPQTVFEIENVIYSTLQEFGYKPYNEGNLKGGYRGIIISVLKDCFAFNNLYRMIKINLPLFIWIFSIFGKRIPVLYLALKKSKNR